jgi:hypothetical protein
VDGDFVEALIGEALFHRGSNAADALELAEGVAEFGGEQIQDVHGGRVSFLGWRL